MKNQEQYKRILRFVFCLTLLSIHMTLFWYTWKIYYSPRMEDPFFMKGHWMLAAIYGLSLILFAKPYGSWKIGYQKVFHIIYAQCISTCFSNIMMYLMITLLTKHFETWIPLFYMFLIQIATSIIWAIIFTRIYIATYPPKKVLLIYGDRPISGLICKLKSRTDRFIISDSIHIDQGLDFIKAKIPSYEGVVICDLPSHDRNVLLKYCYDKSIRTYTSPKISDILIRSAENQHMFDTPLLLSRNSGLTLEQRLGKRALDIALSLAALIIFSPIFVLTALAIKLQDGGPIFFFQKRVTINGKEFFICKFRSMIVDAEQDGKSLPAIDNDPRITEIGRFLRATRIDELPQIFNILKGDMSIVGPRPERTEHIEAYCSEIPEFSYRLKVRGGLTGYAQVYGKYNTTAYDKLKLDLMYIQNYSIKLDIEIILKTIQVLFEKERTDGFSIEQRTPRIKKNDKM